MVEGWGICFREVRRFVEVGSMVIVLGFFFCCRKRDTGSGGVWGSVVCAVYLCVCVCVCVCVCACVRVCVCTTHTNTHTHTYMLAQ